MRLKTSQVADILQEPYHRIHSLIRARRIRVPKDGSGDLLWTQADVRKVTGLLAKSRRGRPKKTELAE
jgi:hypothetical protein